MIDIILGSERNIVAAFLVIDFLFSVLITYVLCMLIYLIRNRIRAYVRAYKKKMRRRKAKVYGYSKRDKYAA